MRVSARLIAIICLGLFPIEARAQESSIPLSVDSVTPTLQQQQRTPMLVLQGSAATSQTVKPDSSKPQDASKAQDASKTQVAPPKEGKNKSASPAATPATATPPQPIVLPAAQQAAQPAPYNMASTGNARYDELIAQSAARHGVDPNLIVAVMRQESGFNVRARSYKGATGLMQLMPATARRFGVSNIYDPAENIDAGARYLRFLLDTFNGDVELALAGYNAGEGAVIKYGYTVPRYRETQNYVRSISARYGSAKHKAGSANKALASAGPAAPAAMTFTGGASTRLSNNY